MQSTVVPEDLAAIPPGPGLAAALGAVALGRVPNDRLLEVLRAQYRQLCHDQARMTAVIAEVGRCQGYPDPGRVQRLEAPGRYASEETRAALCWTRNASECEHDLAETIVHQMPELFTAWLAGEVDRQRVRVFDRYLTGLSPAQITAICRAAVPRAPRLTTGQLAVLLRRMVIAVDPAAAARWYRKGIRERDVTAHIGPDGTVVLSANGLPADEAEAACIRLQDLAAAAKRAGHPGLIGQIRCDLFLGMLDGRFHHMTCDQVISALIADYHPSGPAGPAPEPSPSAVDAETASSPTAGSQSGGSDSAETGGTQLAGAAGRAPAPATAPARDERIGIEIRVGLATLLGRDEHPAEIPGLGLLPAADARHRVARQSRAEWRFAVTDAEGRLIVEGLTRRRPHTGRGRGRGACPPGGIVELHIPLALLEELVAGGLAAAPDEWFALIADIAEQYAGRENHHQNLDSRPGDRRPGVALRRHTEIRDRHCTFTGCRHRAHTSDQDHTHDHHRGGDTVRANLGPVCAHDHAVKHEGGWTVEQPVPGTFIWHSRLGGVYPTRGAFLLPPMPEPAPADLGPRFDHPTRSVGGPILQHRPPDPPRKQRPPYPRGDPDDPAPF